MLRDSVRNDLYDEAIRLAVQQFTDTHGRPPTVLDIGTGSGLLAMMAARCVCVHVCVCARACVRACGRVDIYGRLAGGRG